MSRTSAQAQAWCDYRRVVEAAPLTLSTPDLCRLAGITHRQADHWVRRGHLVPLPRPEGAGSGYSFAYLPSEVAVARFLHVFVRFVGWGNEPRGWIADIAEQVRAGERGHVSPISGVTFDLAVICEESA